MAYGDTFRSGWAGQLGVREESTLGTFLTVAAGYFLPFRSHTLQLNRSKEVVEEINSTRDNFMVFQGTEQVEGTVEFNLNMAENSVVLLLKHAMGGTVSTVISPTNTAYAHTFFAGDMANNASTVNATNMVGLSFYAKYGETTTGAIAYYGCRVDQLTIKGEQGQPVVVTADIIGVGGSITTLTPPTATFSSQLPLLFNHISISEADNIGSITSGTSIKFTSFELTIKNNIQSDDDARSLGSRGPTVLPAGRREVSLKLGQRFDTTTSWDRTISQGDTMSALRIDINSGITIGASPGDATYRLTIDLPTMKWSIPMPDVSDAGILTQEAEPMIFADRTVTAYAIRMTGYNATSGY